MNRSARANWTRTAIMAVAICLGTYQARAAIDMIVTAISRNAANPATGQPVIFSATIKNQGTTATPAGVKNGVVFSIDGATATWSDNNTASIAPGASVTVTANGGPTGSASWIATAGSHTVDAWVNDALRYPESSTSNNHLTAPITVASGSADMIVTAISMTPANPVNGQAVTFSATIKNQGTAATPGGTIRNGLVFSIDGATATWSDNNFTSIAPGASVTVTANGGPTGSATWTATTGSHTIDAWVNDARVYPESNTNNNHLQAPLTVAAGIADMIVVSSSMSPASPVAGQAVTFSAVIKNQGTLATPAGVKNGVVFSIDGATATWSDNNTSSIAPGASVTVTANGGPTGSATWTAAAGSHSLDCWVNDAARYPEGNTNNNHLVSTISVSAGQADMIVTGISMNPATPAAGQAVTFSATIKNQGTAATPGGTSRNGVVFSIDGSTATWSDNNFTAIQPGASVTVTANGGPAGSATWTAVSGSHTLDAWVNDANVYPESDTSNNHLAQTINVGSGKADMIVTGISMSPASPAAGQAVTFSATIKNQGTAATPGGTSRNGVVFSIDGATATWSDNNFTAIQPGGSVTVTANGGPAGSATWTAVSGSHTLDAWVNDANVYPESNTNNNHLAQTITVGGGAPSPVGQNGSLYTLTFQEEFNGTSLNTSVWNDHVWYESSDPDINYAVENGVLKIWPSGPTFHNRTIDTDGKYYQTYGYYEAEMKLPIGYGCWPAFWLYNHDGATARPEIDIMEAYPGGGPNSGWGDANLHPILYAGTCHQPEAGSITGPHPNQDLSAAFHVYGCKWVANSVTFYFDGVSIGTANISQPNRMYILLDLWFGSASGDPNDPNNPKPPTGKGNSFQVNYVRAWRLN